MHKDTKYLKFLDNEGYLSSGSYIKNVNDVDEFLMTPNPAVTLRLALLDYEKGLNDGLFVPHIGLFYSLIKKGDDNFDPHREKYYACLAGISMLKRFPHVMRKGYSFCNYSKTNKLLYGRLKFVEESAFHNWDAAFIHFGWDNRGTRKMKRLISDLNNIKSGYCFFKENNKWKGSLYQSADVIDAWYKSNESSIKRMKGE